MAREIASAAGSVGAAVDFIRSAMDAIDGKDFDAVPEMIEAACDRLNSAHRDLAVLPLSLSHIEANAALLDIETAAEELRINPFPGFHELKGFAVVLGKTRNTLFALREA